MFEKLIMKLFKYDPRPWVVIERGSMLELKRFRKGWQADNYLEEIDHGGHMERVFYRPRVGK